MKINFRIGMKFAVASGIGILLVVAMVGVQQLSNATIERADATSSLEHSVLEEAYAAQIEVKGAQVAYRGIRLANTPQAVRAAAAALKGAGEAGAARIDSAITQMTSAEARAPLERFKSLLTTYVVTIGQVAPIQEELLGRQAKQIELAEVWDKEWKAARALPAMATLLNRGDIEISLLEADAEINEIRAFFWRYLATGDTALVAKKGESVAEAGKLLDQIRTLTRDATILAAIGRLEAIVAQFKSNVDAAMDMNAEQDRLVQLAIPARTEMEKLSGEAIARAKQSADEAGDAAMAAMRQSEWFGRGMGLFVVAVLIGSAFFAGYSIARPVRRIGEVLLTLAGGDKAVEIPYTTRGDEIGDAARAAHTFRDNLVRMEEMEAEQRAAEVRAAEDKRLADLRAVADKQAAEEKAAAERKATMHALAGQFEAAVGNIIETVSSAATELEATATTLTKTAEVTQELSASVAAASEEASANVESVASASEEMSSSVDEIGRQVQASSRMTADAVKQAQSTDARISELSQAASRIGDVVKLITAVAEQTNLLALNATIEAARAGEAGRGFAIVASEVKALAGQTAKATEEIASQVSGMQAATSQSVKAIQEIGTTIGRVNEIAAAIAAAVEEQGAATSEIARNVQQAAKGTADVSSNITDVTRGASETGSASAQVLASAQSLARESTMLKTEVAKFLETVRAA